MGPVSLQAKMETAKSLQPLMPLTLHVSGMQLEGHFIAVKS